MNTRLILRHDEAAFWGRDASLLLPRGALAATMLYNAFDKLRDPAKASAIACGALKRRAWPQATEEWLANRTGLGYRSHSTTFRSVPGALASPARRNCPTG